MMMRVAYREQEEGQGRQRLIAGCLGQLVHIKAEVARVCSSLQREKGLSR